MKFPAISFAPQGLSIAGNASNGDQVYKRCGQFGRILGLGEVGHLWASNTTEVDSSSRESPLGVQNFQKRITEPESQK